MKTREEILKQDYLTAKDVKTLIPTMGLSKCLEFIEETRADMKSKKLFVPNSKPKIALTKIVKKKLGIE